MAVFRPQTLYEAIILVAMMSTPQMYGYIISFGSSREMFLFLSCFKFAKKKEILFIYYSIHMMTNKLWYIRADIFKVPRFSQHKINIFRLYSQRIGCGYVVAIVSNSRVENLFSMGRDIILRFFKVLIFFLRLCET